MVASQPVVISANRWHGEGAFAQGLIKWGWRQRFDQVGMTAQNVHFTKFSPCARPDLSIRSHLYLTVFNWNDEMQWNMYLWSHAWTFTGILWSSFALAPVLVRYLTSSCVVCDILIFMWSVRKLDAESTGGKNTGIPGTLLLQLNTFVVFCLACHSFLVY